MVVLGGPVIFMLVATDMNIMKACQILLLMLMCPAVLVHTFKNFGIRNMLHKGSCNSGFQSSILKSTASDAIVSTSQINTASSSSTIPLETIRPYDFNLNTIDKDGIEFKKFFIGKLSSLDLSAVVLSKNEVCTVCCHTKHYERDHLYFQKPMAVR